MAAFIAGPQRLRIEGHVRPGFEAVRDAFAENFARRRELGGACCVYYRGEKVVDLWGGIRNKSTGEPWQADTMPMQRAMRVIGYKTPGMLMRHYDGLPAQAEPPALAADKKMRILVVEDNRDSAETLQKLLELCGYSVTVAYSSKEGLEAAAKTLPDVVLCDIRLPDSDGYAFAEALRGNPKTARARLIAVTGYGGAQDRKRSREAGFQLHLVKPVKPENLLQQLAQPAKPGYS